MKTLISCAYNMDNCCVELKFADGSMIAIDTIAVENEGADNMYQRSELDWLIYNKPLEYAQLVLSNDLVQYLQGIAEHRLADKTAKEARKHHLSYGLLLFAYNCHPIGTTGTSAGLC